MKHRETVYSLVVKGGILMVPIGICSLVLLTLAIERAITLRKGRVNSPGLLERIFQTIPQRGRMTREDVLRAQRLCEEKDTIVSRLLRTGVDKIHRDETRAQAFVEEAAGREVHLLKRKLRVFAVITSLAPLLGLLGTVFGMITCFENAAAADAAARAESLARGIYEALVATAAGLSVAVPSLVLYHYFQGKIDRIFDLIDEVSTEFLDHYYGTAAAGRTRAAPVHDEPAPAPGPFLAAATRGEAKGTVASQAAATEGIAGGDPA